jgi:hypothetical protein
VSEAVTALPPTNLRLISPFHGWDPEREDGGSLQVTKSPTASQSRRWSLSGDEPRRNGLSREKKQRPTLVRLRTVAPFPPYGNYPFYLAVCCGKNLPGCSTLPFLALLTRCVQIPILPRYATLGKRSLPLPSADDRPLPRNQKNKVPREMYTDVSTDVDRSVDNFGPAGGES